MRSLFLGHSNCGRSDGHALDVPDPDQYSQVRAGFGGGAPSTQFDPETETKFVGDAIRAICYEPAGGARIGFAAAPGRLRAI